MNPTAPHVPIAPLFAALLLCACSSPETPAAAGGDPPVNADAGADSAPPPLPCDAASVDGILVAAVDVYGGPSFALGYPPYAIDGCRLAYVAAPLPGEASGALYLRDLVTGAETLLEAAADLPRRPTMAGDIIAWEAFAIGSRVVRVRAGDETATIAGPFHHAGEPRAAPDGVVVTAWVTASELGDTDIFLFRPGDAEASPIAPGPGQQRFADISLTHIAYADFSEDPDGTFNENATDLADIVVYERASALKTPRKREGKQAFPLLGADGSIAFLGWGPDHPEPKFSAYSLLVGDLVPGGDLVAASITTSTPYIRPVARGSLVEWIDWPSGDTASLWRRPVDLSAEAEKVPGLDGMPLFGPTATTGITIVSTLMASGAMGLRGVAR